ncbi:MAG TPA: acyl-CoA dehydrogenase family protein [Galbitalea sp.]|jgi:alkylation response protein AidB-like acyl-CoA dehydrogenase|nr:acyl-CoA dehydrogenase family protein [Galbitalea sp.]
MPNTTTETAAPAEAVLEKIRALGPTLRERAPEAESAGRLSDETIADLAATGAFDIGSPREYGGLELTVLEQFEIVAEVSQWDGSCGWAVWAGASTNWIPAGCGKRVIEEVYGPKWTGPRVAGSSHFPASRGKVKRVEDGWVVSGGPWTFASDSLWAPFTNLGCIADDGNGPYLVGVQMPVENLNFLDDWHVAGMRGTGSVSLTLTEDEILVPEHRGVVFSEILSGKLESGLAGSLWKAPTLGWAFSTMAGMSIGIAKGALERFIERSAGRPIRGTTYTNQLEAPLTHLMLSEVHSKLRSAELMTRANAEETDRLGRVLAAGESVDPAYLQRFSARVLVETAYAAKWCAEAIELVQRNSGSTAIMDFEPIQRAWRDARIVTLHGALNLEALAENHGRLMAGLQPLQAEGITTLDRFGVASAKAAT